MKCKLLVWTSELDTVFKQSKEALANATMLVHPCHEAPTSLTVDASDVAVGAVLEQLIDGVWKPLAFFSHQLHPPERKYSAFDRELLALYLAVHHFRYFLEAHPFIAYTDHKPLTLAFAKVSNPWSPRQQRHLAYISEFTTDVRHIVGKDNSVADALSRTPIHTVSAQVGIDYTAMANAQQNDEDIKAYRTAITLAQDRPAWRAAIRKGTNHFEKSRLQSLDEKRPARKNRVPNPSTAVPCLLCGKICASTFGLQAHMRKHQH